MHPDVMRKIDALVGPPICFVLSLRRRILDLIMPRCRGPLKNVKKILMVKPAEMGSTVLTYSMLKRAQQLWPDVEFHFLVFAENTAVVEMLGLVPQANIHKLRTADFKTFASDCISQLLKLRSLRFDVAIDLEFFSRASAILAELSGARSTCGFSRFTMEGLYKGSFFTHAVQYNPHIHTAQTFYSMIEALIQPAGQIPLVKAAVPRLEQLELPKLLTNDSEQHEVVDLMTQVNHRVRQAARLIIINANSSELVPLRRWPIENFIELGKMLLHKYDCFIVLTGVTAEREESERVAAALGEERVVNLVGKTSLRQLLVLYSVCDLMITNDSGPSHFASITDLAVITLFGPETPALYCALGKNRVSLTSELACSPCVSSYNHRATVCNDNQCMKRLKVQTVFAACEKLLEMDGK